MKSYNLKYQIFLVLAIFGLLSANAWGQSDGCAGALPISCGQTMTGSTVGFTSDLLGVGCGTNATSPGVWYTFTGDGSVVTASLCGSGYDTRITVLSGSCGAFTCVSTNDDFCGTQSQVSFSSTLGTTYYILVYGYATGSGNYSLNLSCIVPSGNDVCTGALPLTCGATVTGTTVGATPDGNPGGCLGANNAPGLWYSFIGTGENVQFSLCGSAFDTQIAALVGACGGLTCLAGNDDFCGGQSQVMIPTSAGVTYYIYVTGFGTAAGNFTLSVTCLVPLPNDPCASAETITCGQTIASTTAGAIADPVTAGCYVNNTSPGVWYKFMGTGAPVTASLCGSSFNTQLSAFTGSCASLVCASYNDDFCGSQSQITINTVAGNMYYLYVFGNAGASGAFTLSLTCPPPPPPACYTTAVNPCPNINLGADINLPTCTDPCTPVTITPTIPQINSTSAYTVCAIPYTPYPYNTGTGFSIGVDDVWTGIITLPFHFCFFGTNYGQCRVGSNGVLSFNVGYTGFCPWAFTASCPSALLPINSIFGIYHDIDPAILCGASPCGDARYATFGTAPCRVFVVSWDNVPHFSGVCNPLRTSCEIVLYETSNVIEVFVESKPICASWNSGNALIGIQNSLGTLGYTPPGRNTGLWSASYEGWRFTPSGPTTVAVSWFEQGSPLGTGNTINVCPTEATQTYVATATYSKCDGTQLQYSDDIIIQCAMFLLPVEWLKFELTADASHVAVLWSTASENNNDYFTIQRSFDGVSWTDIGNIDSRGNSHETQSYHFKDMHPLYGTSYYRIKQTDIDGQHDVSEVRSITYSREGELSLFPNPAKDNFTISPWKDSFKVKIFDASGREIEPINIAQGRFDVSQLQKGFYQIEVLDSKTGSINHQGLLIEK